MTSPTHDDVRVKPRPDSLVTTEQDQKEPFVPNTHPSPTGPKNRQIFLMKDDLLVNVNEDDLEEQIKRSQSKSPALASVPEDEPLEEIAISVTSSESGIGYLDGLTPEEINEIISADSERAPSERRPCVTNLIFVMAVFTMAVVFYFIFTE